MERLINEYSFDFERNFQAEPAIKWAAENWLLSIALVIIYMMGIQIGTAQVAKMKEPFDLKYPLAAWNAFLSIFSFIGMCKTVRSHTAMLLCYSICSFSWVLSFSGASVDRQLENH